MINSHKKTSRLYYNQKALSRAHASAKAQQSPLNKCADIEMSKASSGCWGMSPSPADYGVLGSVVSSPSGVRDGAQPHTPFQCHRTF